MQTILVTGGGGFIGSNLVTELAKRSNTRVVVCDSFGSSNKWRNLAKHPVWEMVAPQDMWKWLEENCDALDVVYHLGGISSTTETNIDLILENNFTLSVRLWRWCVDNCKRFIYGSSSAAYGGGEEGFDDDISLTYQGRLKPLSGYGWSKQMLDMHVASEVSVGAKLPLQWVALRIFNAYGPNEYHKGDQKSVICKIAQQVIHGGRVQLFRSYNPHYENGEQLRDMIYVKDVAKVMVWLLDNPGISGLFNLGTGKGRSFNDMANATFSALERPPRIHYIDMPALLLNNYQYYTEAKMDRLHKAGYNTPFTSLEEGIKDYVLNYLMKEDPYR